MSTRTLPTEMTRVARSGSIVRRRTAVTRETGSRGLNGHDARDPVAGLAQAAGDLPAVDLRHHQVEHDQGRVDRPDLLERLPPVAGRLDLVSLAAKVEPHQLDDVRLVVDDEDGRG
jgi:hypothetical protein